jgi:GR25 family glycosyltransferase involved in LPS biosynthesis
MLLRKDQQLLEKYFKKPVDKPRPNGIRKVDFIYMISLNHGRFSRSIGQLSQYNIRPYRFEAVDGSTLPQETINQLGTPTFCHGMSRKQIGTALSHLSVLQDAYESGYETIWVMEDDIQVIQNPSILSGLIDELDGLVGDWDLLYTDIEAKASNGKLVPCLAISPRPNFPPNPLAHYLRRLRLSENFTEIGMRYGCYSMIIRRSGIKKILEYFKKYRIYLPIDMDLFFIPGLKQITCNHEIVSHMPDDDCNKFRALLKLFAPDDH